jgi:hypothetical protein
MVRNISLAQDFGRDTRAIWAAITEAAPESLYRQGDGIVWLIGKPGTIKPRSVTPTVLRRFVTDHFQLSHKPSKELFENMLAGPPPDLPMLRGIVRVPVFTKDGMTEPGYCPSAELYCDPDFQLLPPSEEPLLADVECAKEELNGLLHNFPFDSDASKANAIGSIFLPFVRPLIKGPTPIIVITKPKPRTGATLLAQAIAQISGSAVVINPPEDEGEQKRVLFATLREMPHAIILDNVKNLKGRALASILTTRYLRDRVIGSSALGEAENRTMWFATGNNPELSDEIAGRTVPVVIDAGMEHPDQRTDFLHPHLLEWVQQQREVLVWAVLTIIQHWFQQGRPGGTEILGGFEDWAETIGGVLACAGIPGFLENLEIFRCNTDHETRNIANFIRSWANEYGNSEVIVANILALATDLDLGTGTGRSRNIRLGKMLQTREGQRFGCWIIKRGAFVNGYQRWRLDRGCSGCGVCGSTPVHEKSSSPVP